MRKTFVLLAVLASTVPVAAQEPADGTAYRVDSDSSWIRVLAWPDGPLKRFGHHHVISHQAISGKVTVAPDPLESTFELRLSVADLVVDNPGQRALEGEEFEGEVPEKDIEGTRGNMLGDRLLHGEQFPVIQLRSSAIEGDFPDVNIVTTVIVREMENTVTFPATVELTDDTFVVSGEIELNHEAFGLEPFTAMGGALSVRDLLVLKYRIAGTRIADMP